MLHIWILFLRSEKSGARCSIFLELNKEWECFPSFIPVFLAHRPKAEVSASISFEQECIIFFSEIVQIFGVPKSVGQIYGLLYSSPEPLGFQDIVEQLNISKGSASQGLQLLRSLGAIAEADRSSQIAGFSPGMKRSVAYQPELSLRQLITGILRERIAPMAVTGADRLARLKELAGQTPVQTKFYLGRAKQLETWRKRFTAVMPLLTALLGPKK
ncbi:MAG: hypothetical protein QM760_13565 [Nibricoccus sp.]